MLLNHLHLQTARCLRPCIRQPLSFLNARSRIPQTKRWISDLKPQLEVPSFREQIARSTPLETFSEQVKRPSIRNQFFFFIFGSYFAFAFAATKTNIDTEHWSKKITVMSTLWSSRQPTSDEMRRTQQFELGGRLQGYVSKLKEVTLGWPIAIKNFVFVTYVNIAQPYLNASEGRRLCWKICLINAGIWVAWQMPKLQMGMRRAFMHHPLSGLSYTMLTSTFSHKSFLHLVFNSLALASFGSAATNFLTKEQYNSESGLQESTSTWHFLAFFISAGLFSGLVSHVAATRIIFPRMISQLSSTPAAAAATSAAMATAEVASRTSPILDILPSLGASGAIYAAVTLTALGFPDSDIGILFLPGVAFPIQWGVGALAMLDVVGVLRGWRTFDHFAHLGGAAFGVMYYHYGPKFWDGMRVRYSKSVKLAADPEAETS